MPQDSSIDKHLNKFGRMECNSFKSPLEKGLQLTPNPENIELEKPYRELLGTIMYLMICVRPDLCYAVGYMGRFQQNPILIWNIDKH